MSSPTPSAPVPPPDYAALAQACLDSVAKWLEDFDPDEVDFSTSDGIVAIEFPDGTKYILNRQSAAHQMWFAAGARAYHYDYDPARAQWVDDRDGHALFDRISEAVSAKLGRAVHV